MQDVPTDNKLWEEACEPGWQVTRKGHNLPAQDLIIAACAIRAETPVLTYDRHFDVIPGVRVLRSLDELRSRPGRWQVGVAESPGLSIVGPNPWLRF